MGYISAHDIKNGFKEVAVISTNESSHKSKKGFYRMTRMEDKDILIVGSWRDVSIFYFAAAATVSNGGTFEKVVFLPSLHESIHKYNKDLIYSLMLYGQYLFTCSDDCTINQIELER